MVDEYLKGIMNRSEVGEHPTACRTNKPISKEMRDLLALVVQRGRLRLDNFFQHDFDCRFAGDTFA